MSTICDYKLCMVELDPVELIVICSSSERGTIWGYKLRMIGRRKDPVELIVICGSSEGVLYGL